MSFFGCLVKTIAGYALFSDGEVERHNGILKRKLRKLTKEKEFSLEATIAHALFAKNSILDVNGLFLYQKIYGLNPKMGVQKIYHQDLTLPVRLRLKSYKDI